MAHKECLRDTRNKLAVSGRRLADACDTACAQLKHGPVAADAKIHREAAKAAADLGGDKVAEMELRAFTKETEADVEKALVDALEGQRVELESDAFGKSQAAKLRPGPFSG